MKRSSKALAALLATLFLSTWVAAAESGRDHVSGIITVWNASAKKFTVKDTAGKETSIGWTEKTAVVGKPEVGVPVNVAFTRDRNEGIWATRIQAGARLASNRPPMR